jgi:2-C-methyl-D-erythritol 4-phosphate cytidylyltransferase
VKRRIFCSKAVGDDKPGSVVAIVAAAGSGQRLGGRTKKPFVKLSGKPIIIRTLEALSESAAIDDIIVAIESSCLLRFKRLVSGYRSVRVSAVVAGGKTRAESVGNCLAYLDDRCEIVLIHDGGRPLVDGRTVAEAVKAARRYGACAVAVPESDTVKVVGRDMFIKRTLDRNLIFRAQTPQAFKRSVITEAYMRRDPGATDDASLVERSGGRVKVVIGSYRNIKITTKEDLKIAGVLL